MDLGLKDRTALVTAGSRGFGLATAQELAAEGARVALCARGAADLEAAAAAVAAVAGADRVTARALDVTDDAAVADYVGHVEKTLGPIDLMLVNAGGPPAGTFRDVDLDQWEAAYRLTLESAVRLCRLVLLGMMERRFGRIVAITSVSVRQPVENLLLSSVLRPAVQVPIGDTLECHRIADAIAERITKEEFLQLFQYIADAKSPNRVVPNLCSWLKQNDKLDEQERRLANLQ